MKKEKKGFNPRYFKMTEEELQMWMRIRKKCHTHDNENKKAYTRKEKHKKKGLTMIKPHAIIIM